MLTTNQIGRELTRRLVESTGCDLQTAVRFFYNSDLYGEIEKIVDSGCDVDALFVRFENEFTGASSNTRM